MNSHDQIEIQIDNISVPIRYVVVEPPKNTENGSAIFFLHGIRSSTRYFATIADHFAEIGFHCFILEYPGYDGENWGGSALLDRHDFSSLSKYVYLAWRKISENYEFRSWSFWGHSMGGGILFRTIRDHPEIFAKSDRIILEAPAFSEMIRFGSKFTIGFGKFMNRGKFRQSIAESVLKLGYAIRGRKSLGKSGEIIGNCDNFTVFAENADSMLDRSNAFDRRTAEKIGLDHFIWIWSPKDLALKAKPPKWFPKKNVITLSVDHDISFSDPDQIFKRVLARLR